MKRVEFLFVLTAGLIAAGSFADSILEAGETAYVGGTEKLEDGNAPVRSFAGLQDYLRYAALNNAGLKAAFEQWKAAIEQIPQAQTLPDPTFTYNYFIERDKMDPARHKLGLMQVFPWFGKVEARTDAAAAAAKSAGKQFDSARFKLFFEVKDAFYEYAYLAKAVEIATENLELVKHFEEVARTKYITAAAGHPDVIRAQVELAKIEDQLKTLEALREPTVAKLNALLNRRSFEMLPWPRPGKSKAGSVDRTEIIAKLKANNPELAAMNFELEMAKRTVELAKKNFYPDIGVGIETMDMVDVSKDPVMLMFSVNLPIWRTSYKAAELQAEANVRKTSQQRTEMENSLVARAARAIYDFEDSRRKVRLYGDILIPKAEELLGVSEAAYQTGAVDFLSLTDAQRTLLEYKLRYERAVTDNLQRLAELEMLAGTELATISEPGLAQ